MNMSEKLEISFTLTKAGFEPWYFVTVNGVQFPEIGFCPYNIRDTEEYTKKIHDKSVDGAVWWAQALVNELIFVRALESDIQIQLSLEIIEREINRIVGRL